MRDNLQYLITVSGRNEDIIIKMSQSFTFSVGLHVVIRHYVCINFKCAMRLLAQNTHCLI